MRTRAILLVGLAAIVAAAPAPAIAKNKCVYWFGFCTSCEKPYTCKNSRRTDKAKATTPKTARAKPKKRTPITIGRRRKPPTPTRAARFRRQQVIEPQTTNLDREFRHFKQFIRRKQRDGKLPANQKLADLYFRFKLWVLERDRTRAKPH